MDYVIDIKDDHFQHAMKSLGISSDELLIKRIEDFDDKDSIGEVQRMRFNFFRRKQRELVRKIKEIAEDHQNKSVSSNLNLSEFDGYSQERAGKTPSPFLKLKKKHKELIDKHLANVQSKLMGFKNLQCKLKNGDKLREEIRNSVTNRKKFKLMNIENRLSEKNKNRSVTSFTKRKKTPFEDFLIPSNEVSLHKPAASRDYEIKFHREKSSESDHEINAKIQKLEEKMEKSKEIKSVYMNLKKLAASKFNKKVFKSAERLHTDFSNDYNDRVIKLIEKSSDATRRKIKLQKIQTESRLKQRLIDEEKRSKTKAKLQSYEDELKRKYQKIIAKEYKSELKLSQVSLKQQKDYLLKSELNRLREEEIHQNAIRKKRAL